MRRRGSTQNRVPRPGRGNAAVVEPGAPSPTPRTAGGRLPPGSRRPAPGQSGFTLIELLLATALIAIIMAMAYGGFRAAVRASASGDELIEETNRLRVVHQFIRSRINQVRPLVIEETGPGEHIVFEGDGERIRFVAPMPGYLSYGGPYVQELRLERGEVGMDLVFAFAMLNSYEPGDLDAEPPVTLLEDVGRAEFEFLGFEEDGETVVWTPVWEQPDQVPIAVSLRLGLARDNGVTWPELVAPVVLDASSGNRRPRRVEDVRDRILGIDPESPR